MRRSVRSFVTGRIGVLPSFLPLAATGLAEAADRRLPAVWQR
jgi:hypothetical protein